MSFSALKSKRIVKKTERILKGKNNQSSLRISKDVKTVGIIFSEGTGFNFKMLKKLQKEIGSGSDKFSILTCKTANENYNEFRGVAFTEKDFSWNGKLNSKDVKSFLDNPFDMLIDYTKAKTIYTKYLVANSKAQFKVGFANIDERLYDLMIHIEDDFMLFNAELIKYLKILKKL